VKRSDRKEADEWFNVSVMDGMGRLQNQGRETSAVNSAQSQGRHGLHYWTMMMGK
jgi:hypothetical protein